jgi:3-isopropylmalate/(R)-2-methylmalate dehydratase small subunit
LPIEIDKDIVMKISDQDILEIDLKENKITNLTKNETYSIKPFPELISKIINAGGLVNFRI